MRCWSKSCRCLYLELWKWLGVDVFSWTSSGYLFCPECGFTRTRTQSNNGKTVIFLQHFKKSMRVYIPFHRIVLVEIRTLLKCITASDVVMILKQSSAGETGCSPQLAGLFCQHHFKRLQYGGISVKLLVWCILCCCRICISQFTGLLLPFKSNKKRECCLCRDRTLWFRIDAFFSKCQANKIYSVRSLKISIELCAN